MLCSEPLAARLPEAIDARDGEAGIVTRGIVGFRADSFQPIAKKTQSKPRPFAVPSAFDWGAQPRGERPGWGAIGIRGRTCGTALGRGPLRNCGRLAAILAAPA